MKILLTADPEIPVPPVLYGGIERILDNLIHGYLQRGHDVTLIAHPDSKVPCQLVPWKGGNGTGASATLRNTATVFRQVVNGRFDVVHSFSRLAYLLPALPMAVPKLMSYQREPTLGQIGKAARLARKNSLLFTGCSDYISRQIVTIAPAATVYNCVPLERFRFSPEVAPDAPLMFLGRIEPIKGTHIAIEVARRTGRRLIIAGNIPAEGTAYFAEKIQPFLNDQIQYVGPLNDVQKNNLLGQSAAFLMPIQWNEPFGIVMAEAMACGTPVLGFPYGSVPEVVENGRSGFVCAGVEEMIAKIGALDQLHRTRVRQAAAERFSQDTIVEDYLRLYRQLMASGSRSFVKQTSAAGRER